MKKAAEAPGQINDKKTKCGIIMPISAMGDLPESHWAEVLEILMEVIDDSGLEGDLVSNADDVGVIHKRIVQNIYENEIVICDISGKNANVMFELGLRIAFDKPVVIVKDDKTPYSFDTSPIEHIEYPRDLRFSKIVDFKKKLKDKLLKTLEVFRSDPNYSPFLKHFGEFKVAKVSTKEVSSDELILDEIKSLREIVLRKEVSQVSITDDEDPLDENEKYKKENKADICVRSKSRINYLKMEKGLSLLSKEIQAKVRKLGPDHCHVIVNNSNKIEMNSVLNEILEAAPSAKIRVRKW